MAIHYIILGCPLVCVLPLQIAVYKKSLEFSKQPTYKLFLSSLRIEFFL